MQADYNRIPDNLNLYFRNFMTTNYGKYLKMYKVTMKLLPTAMINMLIQYTTKFFEATCNKFSYRFVLHTKSLKPTNNIINLVIFSNEILPTEPQKDRHMKCQNIYF